MPSTIDMGETRVKRVVELMLNNDAPMQCMLGLPQIFRAGHIESQEIYDALTREAISVRNIYAEINAADLDDETGKPVIETNKPIIAEYFRDSIPIWEASRHSGFKPQIVPARLDEICSIVNLSIDKYQKLLGDLIYKKSKDFGYLEQDHSRYRGTRMHWILAGKPVIYHPEKLSQVVEFVNELARAK